MQAFPHTYVVSASGESAGNLDISADGLPDLEVAPPTEFDGPGDVWSPESLFVSSLASCFILSFRAVAAASRFDWVDIRCEASGVLDRIEKVTQFTSVTHRVTLTVNARDDVDKAEKLLHKAESVCLVSNSITADIHLETDIRVA